MGSKSFIFARSALVCSGLCEKPYEKGSQGEGNHSDDEVFGVGIEKGSGTIFWFHEKTKEDE